MLKSGEKTLEKSEVDKVDENKITRYKLTCILLIS